MSSKAFIDQWKKNKEKYKKAQEAKKQKDREKFGGGGGGGKRPPAFSLRMRYGIPNEEIEKCRFIPFNKDQKFYKYYKTWIKVGNKPRTAICNCEQMEKPVPCVPCHYVAEDDRQDFIPKPSNAITRLHLSDFHKVMVKNPKTGKEYPKYVKCKGVDRFGNSQCEHCDNGVEKSFGRRDHISLSNKQMRQFLEALEDLSEKCGGCGEGELSTWGYSCPECGGVLASHKEAKISEEEEDMFRNHEITCPHCEKENIKAVPEVECVVSKISNGVQTYVAGCDDPKPVDPWAVDVFISKKDGSFQIHGWSHPDDPEGMEDYKKKPFDFDYFFGGQDLSEQARALSISNPFSEEDQKILEEYWNAPNEEEKAATETISY